MGVRRWACGGSWRRSVCSIRRRRAATVGGVDHAAGELAPRAAEILEREVAVGERVEVEVKKGARAGRGETHGEDFFIGRRLEEEKARELSEENGRRLADEVTGGVALAEGSAEVENQLHATVGQNAVGRGIRRGGAAEIPAAGDVGREQRMGRENLVEHSGGEGAGRQPDVRAALFFRIDPDDFADGGIGFENLAHGLEEARELRRRIDRVKVFFSRSACLAR